MEYESKKKFIIDIVFIVTIAAVVYFVFKYMIGWFIPFLVGLFLVAIMQPLSKQVSKLIPLKNKGATFCSLVILYIGAGLLIWFGVAAIVNKCSEFVYDLPTIFQTNIMPLMESFNDWTVGLADKIAPDAADLISNVSGNLTSEIASLVANFSSSSINYATDTIRQLPMYLVTLVFTIMCSIFISLNYPAVKDFLKRQFPEKGQKIIDFLRVFIKDKLSKVLKAYFLIMIVTFVENAIGLTILGIEHSIAIAALIAVCDILPIIGSGTILIPWAIMKLVTADFFVGIGLLVLYAIIAVIRNAIEPKIVGTQIGLHPIVTITAMYAGLKIFGFVGFFLGPIVVLFLILLHDEGYIKIWK